MNYEQRTTQGFTLIELLVSIGILAMIISIAGVIFRVGVDSHRTALANAEIMQKLRTITDHLNRDFKGFTKPAAVAFPRVSVDNPIRSDRIAFFSNGDFQSTRQYGENSDKTVVGNVARIYYGQSSEPYPRTNNPQDFREVILVRKAQILTEDDSVLAAGYEPNDPNERDEYSLRSLSEWKLLTPPPDDQDAISKWIGRPNAYIDSSEPEKIETVIPLLMAKGVHDFKIQFIQDFTTDGKLQWWPTNDDLREGDNSGMGYLSAIKFTFTLYDSKGVIKDGRTFTHIVCLN